MDFFNYRRRSSHPIAIGQTPLGGEFPIRIQSMTNTSTLDTEASVAQCIGIIDAGADYVRLTAQGEREARNLGEIKQALAQRGYHTPLVADIHFNPKAAFAAAETVDKVRINPGNFVDSARTFKELTYTDEEYKAEIEKIADRLIPFLSLCRTRGTAIRIGVNHGSLSDRIMSRYGNTPEGMVESCMEFLRICQSEKFENVAVSMKASNTTVMVCSVRLLISAMEREDMHYPLHLGVTEAGDGEDGRIKSAVGIGALLADGIGDTIRVSLSEDPEVEIPVARKLVDYLTTRCNHPKIEGEATPSFNYYAPSKREVRQVQNIGGRQVPVVISQGGYAVTNKNRTPDLVYHSHSSKKSAIPSIIPANQWQGETNSYPIFSASETTACRNCEAELKFIRLELNDLDGERMELLKTDRQTVVILHSRHVNPVGEMRAFFHRLMLNNCDVPVILSLCYRESDSEALQLKAAADFGALLLDYFGEGIFIENEGEVSTEQIDSYQFAILQAARQRTTQTEYISCPSCGRTLFDLQTTIARVKAATSHLHGLKIGIMGCIVNGPGEMADADYGYVGAGRGRVSLYKGKACVEKNIPEEEAVAKLIELIRINGDWVDRP